MFASSDDDAPLLSEDFRRNVVSRVAGSVSVSDFVQTVPDSIAQFPVLGLDLSDCGDPRADHRRSLVVEVAPFVCATAVSLPVPDVVEFLELDLRVPAFDPVDSDDEFDDAFPRDGSGGVPVGAVVEPVRFGARHSGRFAALATDVDDDDFDTAHDSPSLVDAEPSQQFGRFAALAEPTKPQSRRLVLVSSTQVDPVPPTVPESVDVVHVNLTGRWAHCQTQRATGLFRPMDGTIILRKNVRSKCGFRCWCGRV